ncbi:MAG TPA: hypothetical protein VGM93_00030, partial [Acidimicrobiales bacterium]
MTPLLCARATCRDPRHQPGCGDQCQPHPARLAADGLRLCQPHTDDLAKHPVQLADLHDELGLALMPGGGGERVGGRGDNGPPAPRDRVVAIRTEIRHTLVSWCRLVADERGIQLPQDAMTALGGYLRVHAAWLAAHGAAGEVSDELDGLRRRAWSVAYPGGTRVTEVGPCPYGRVERLPAGFIGPARQLGCAGTLRAVMRPTEQLLPSEVACDAEVEHRWDSTQWRQLDRLV